MAKKVISIITLETIDQIFQTSKTELSSQEKSLYINCIFAHFKDKLVSKENLEEFSLDIKDIKNYSKWKIIFMKLDKSELIKLTNDAIIFYDKWNLFIDNVHIKIEDKIDHNSIEDLLLNNRSMIEVVAMKNRLSVDEIHQLIKIFIKEQEATETKHKHIGDYSKHFIYWVKINKSNIESKQSSSVKSNSKLLGF